MKYLVSPEDEEWAAGLRIWWRRGYAMVGLKVLQRLILERAGVDITGLVVDHINGLTYDNRRENLRAVTKQSNAHNRNGLNKDNKSGVIGVFWDSERGLWHARCRLNYKKVHIGRFVDLNEATQAVRKWRAENMPASKEARDYKNKI